MSADLEPLMTTDEVAALTRMKASTIRKWTAERRIPFFKVNGAVRFRRSEIEAWIGECAKPVIDERTAAAMLIGGR